MDAQVFGAFIRIRRKELGMNQAELAEKLHVTAKAVSRWERGVGFPDIKLLQPLADALEVSIVELMQSKMAEKEVLPETAAAVVLESVNEIQEQQKLSRTRRIILTLGSLAIWAAYTFVLHLSVRYDFEPAWIGKVLWVIGFAGGVLGERALRFIVARDYLVQKPKTIWNTWQMWIAAGISCAGVLLFLNAWRFHQNTPIRYAVVMIISMVMMLVGVIYYAMHEHDVWE